MRTPYIPHRFGDAVTAKLRSQVGWLTAGVASSIPWPKRDVWVTYAGDDYILRGSENAEGQASPPCITVPCQRQDTDVCLSKIYRFTSILGWYMRGYVDVAGYVSGSHPMLYGDRRQVFSEVGTYGAKTFNCNHMPIIEDESIRKALAFWREGQRLKRVHDSYSFLSFYKVIESQFDNGAAKAAWITANLDLLTGQAQDRITQLRGSGTNVSTHIWESGRCAVAHASLQGEIVDPDIPADRRRLSADLVIMEELARRYISNELHVPDEMALYVTRDRLTPWEDLLEPELLRSLKAAESPPQVEGLNGRVISVGLWPDGPLVTMEAMTMHIDMVQNGIVKIVLVNDRRTLFLVFFLDYPNGKLHTNLDDGGIMDGENEPTEDEALAYYTFFHRVLGNAIVELTAEGHEPIDAEVVIPCNIIPGDPAVAIPAAMEHFRTVMQQRRAAG